MKKNKCQCGCGEIVKPGRRYIRGHNWRGKRSGMYGKHHSEETKKKISKTKQGKKFSEETKKNMSQGHRGKKHSEEAKKKMSLTKQGKKLSKKHCKNISISKKKNWQDSEYAEQQVKAIMDATPCDSPNKVELKVLALLNELFPNEYKFVGNGEFILGGKCPDFMNINGQKKLIEYDSEFWHRKNRSCTEQVADNKRKRHFAKYGYRTCVVHERELFGSVARLKSKLTKFQKALPIKAKGNVNSSLKK